MFHSDSILDGNRNENKIKCLLVNDIKNIKILVTISILSSFMSKRNYLFILMASGKEAAMKIIFLYILIR